MVLHINKVFHIPYFILSFPNPVCVLYLQHISIHVVHGYPIGRWKFRLYTFRLKETINKYWATFTRCLLVIWVNDSYMIFWYSWIELASKNMIMNMGVGFSLLQEVVTQMERKDRTHPIVLDWNQRYQYKLTVFKRWIKMNWVCVDKHTYYIHVLHRSLLRRPKSYDIQ